VANLPVQGIPIVLEGFEGLERRNEGPFNARGIAGRPRPSRRFYCRRNRTGNGISEGAVAEKELDHCGTSPMRLRMFVRDNAKAVPGVMFEVLCGRTKPTLTAATCLIHAHDPNNNQTGGSDDMRRRTFLKLAGGAGASLSAFPAVVRAQEAWPNKPVKIIVPFGAGGGAETR
jgi:hypothetical protein